MPGWDSELGWPVERRPAFKAPGKRAWATPNCRLIKTPCATSWSSRNATPWCARLCDHDEVTWAALNDCRTEDRVHTHINWNPIETVSCLPNAHWHWHLRAAHDERYDISRGWFLLRLLRQMLMPSSVFRLIFRIKKKKLFNLLRQLTGFCELQSDRLSRREHV